MILTCGKGLIACIRRLEEVRLGLGLEAIGYSVAKEVVVNGNFSRSLTKSTRAAI